MYEFGTDMLEDMANEGFSEPLFFYEGTFHKPGKVDRHNVRSYGTENPRLGIQHERDSPKFNVSCAISSVQVYGPFFFAEKSSIGIAYLGTLEHWLFLQLQREMNNFIFMQGGVPPHFHLDVCTFINKTISN